MRRWTAHEPLSPPRRARQPGAPRAAAEAAALAVLLATSASCTSSDTSTNEQPSKSSPEAVKPASAQVAPAPSSPGTRQLTRQHATQLTAARLNNLDGNATSLAAFEGKALLLVNVASNCGLTPQYEGLQRLQEEYGERGFSVIGFPCNQFGGQEPGSPEEIRSFCTNEYGVDFPLMEKIDVNGDKRHPIYSVLTTYPDSDGQAGDVAWNFEKFLIAADRSTITRFRPQTKPYDPALIAALEAALPRE